MRIVLDFLTDLLFLLFYVEEAGVGDEVDFCLIELL